MLSLDLGRTSATDLLLLPTDGQRRESTACYTTGVPVFDSATLRRALGDPNTSTVFVYQVRRLSACDGCETRRLAQDGGGDFLQQAFGRYQKRWTLAPGQAWGGRVAWRGCARRGCLPVQPTGGVVALLLPRTPGTHIPARALRHRVADPAKPVPRPHHPTHALHPTPNPHILQDLLLSPADFSFRYPVNITGGRGNVTLYGCGTTTVDVNFNYTRHSVVAGGGGALTVRGLRFTNSPLMNQLLWPRNLSPLLPLVDCEVGGRVALVDVAILTPMADDLAAHLDAFTNGSNGNAALAPVYTSANISHVAISRWRLTGAWVRACVRVARGRRQGR